MRSKVEYYIPITEDFDYKLVQWFTEQGWTCLKVSAYEMNFVFTEAEKPDVLFNTYIKSKDNSLKISILASFSDDMKAAWFLMNRPFGE